MLQFIVATIYHILRYQNECSISQRKHRHDLSRAFEYRKQ